MTRTAAANMRPLIACRVAARRRFASSCPRETARQEVQGVWIDGLPAAVREDADDPQAILIDLPSNEKYPSVTIYFSTRGGRLGTIGRMEPPLPWTDAPVLWRHWSVMLPPGYELAEHLPDGEDSPPRQVSWSQRLFGPLGRTTDAAPRRRGAAAPAESDSLWASTRLAGFEAEDSRGWLVYRFPVSDAAAVRPVVVHRAAMRLLGLLAFLVALAVAWRAAVDRPLVLCAGTRALAIAALAVPVAYVPIGTGAFLGAMVCVALRLVRPAGKDAPPTPARAAAELPSTVSGILPYSAVALAVVVAMSGASARAADAESKPPKEAPSAPYPVFVPVDERQRPTGGKYYVPEPFYDQLYHRAAAAAEKPQGWLLTAANYRGACRRTRCPDNWPWTNSPCGSS